MNLAKLFTVSAALLALAACAHTPRVAAGRFCEFKRHSLAVPDPSVAALVLSPADTERRLAAQTGPLLFLSGGSQHGAFGAGFLKGWSDERRRLGKGGLPPFAIVTGVSTGAILGTSAFLNDADRAWKAYRITKENQLLDVYARGFGKNEIGVKGGIAAIRHGAIADLVPFRRLMRENLPFELLDRVAAEGRDENGRRFYVAAVNLDTGQAEAFDMTHMAVKVSDAPLKADDGRDKDFYRDCYIEAIAASSSVPFASKPVFIDNRMYIDGGARYAVFSQELGPVIGVSTGLTPSRFVYMIFNGTAQMDARCGKRDEALCKTPEGAAGAQGGHADWAFHSLAFRTVDVLQNQVARLSIAQAERDAAEVGWLRFTRIIEDDKNRFDFKMNNSVFGSERKTCQAWREEDVRIDRPFEFQSRYMHCVSAYGEDKAKRSKWANDP